MNSDRPNLPPKKNPCPGNLPPEVSAVMNEVRRRIRRFVVWQGLLLVVVWLGLSYWIVLGVDRVPVWLGLPELSYSARLVFLLIVAAVVGWLLYRLVLLRLLVPLRTESLALLLERRFPELGDSLATLVLQHDSGDLPAGELPATRPATGTDRPPELARLQQGLQDQAVGQLRTISVRELFNYSLLTRTAGLALIALLTMGWLAVSQPEAFATSLRRLVLLDPEPWPRECHVEMIGLRVRDTLAPDVIPEISATRQFQQGELHVSAGSSVSILVRAESPSPENPDRRLPRQCLFQYRSDDGSRGTLPMNPVGAARDGFQRYAIDGQVLESMAGELKFYVRGDDHRIGPFRILAVAAPTLTESRLDLVYPEYMVDEASSRWTPRSVPLTSGLRLPAGTRATLVSHTNRPLGHAYVVDSGEQLLANLSATADDPHCFELELGDLSEDLQLDIYLRDSTGVVSQSPASVIVGVVEDKPPQIRFRLRGIGTAITPNAAIPISGDVSDDYEIKSVWADIDTPVTSEEVRVPVEFTSRGEMSGTIDLLELRRQGVLPTGLPTGDGSRVSLTIKADDFCDLPGKSNTGVGQQYSLDVVSPAELLRMLERLEADQRRRLEQIYEELTEARENIARSRRSGQANRAGAEPGDRLVPGRSPEQGDTNDGPLRQLFVQRSLLQVQKSTQEIAAVAISFDEIRGQLVNNRIDAEDRKMRIMEKIVVPLRQIAERSLIDLESGLIDLDASYRKLRSRAADPATRQTIDRLAGETLTQADSTLAEIQAVLGAMLKFETRNELLEIVRRLLAEEQELLQRTRALREQEAFDDLFNQ